MGFFARDPRRLQLPEKETALPGRDQPMRLNPRHQVLGTSMQAPFPPDCEAVLFGLGCFWGAERKFWQLPGVYTTAVGYSGGYTPNPTYDEVCSGMTGHNEVVLVVYHPGEVRFGDLLRVFWESHNPTQGMRQGNDIGTQYRSGIYCATDKQLEEAEASRQLYASALQGAGYGEVTTEIVKAGPFFYAEEYHQQYLHKNPAGYCGLGGTGVTCPG
ncbi:peptide-methionine (S)-S-oxide reductase MsrA [Pseudomaricurvus sp. HS19]|uniref:peptide-methionine (S)-S-oxide reductase MsrA n=1 Tax=Pseudomaricurvus sp. HS19 TaxID=2692626 RepID=UPI00136B9EDB|nr:peptide-methionine (S)-S-oxide reductase MsrA [Pseudomaricurvus sp. HS19]MYM62078.1 peptide-methionine (S)-S-oxide reductase MsrA [Pseudomaricurvus sp. HS19]